MATTGQYILDDPRLDLARRLYVNTCCRRESDAVLNAEEILARATTIYRKFPERRLREAKEKLEAAMVLANDIFLSVINGEVPP